MDTVEIRVEEGILRGEKKRECLIFKGVPYAEPPVNENRFRAPVAKKHWDGVKDALQFPPMCPQMDMSKDPFWGKEFYGDPKYPLPKQSEDCLYLNIWAPARPGRYPVAFWIHGGAFDHGFGSEMEFDGEQFAASGVIFVAVQYRVGVFGFYADEALRKENPNRSTGNYGIMDQIAALQWVYRNIRSFGGDESRITVMGQSAGAISVQTLLASPLSSGLIHSAIMHSAAGIDTDLIHTRTMKQALQTGSDIRVLSKIKTVADMRRLPAQKLVEILPALYEKKEGLTFGPVVDDHILCENISDAVKEGRCADVPMMIGVTGNDLSVEDGAWPKSMIFEGVTKLAEARNQHSSKPVYVYAFTRKLPGDDRGAFHSSDLWYVFGTLSRCWRKMERRDYSISYTMIRNWTDFIKNDNPGKEWRAYTDEEKFVRQYI